VTLDCSCDYDPPQVYSSRMVRARKEYRCYECRAKIAVGEQHEYAFGVSDGWTYQPRTCTHCVGIRKFVATNIPCFCWAHGNLIDDCRNIIQASYEQAADEVAGLAFGFGRLLVKAKRARSRK
jgi:hypothetical protein